MGRRKKAAKKVAKKKRAEVARVFKCLFCNHEAVVSCQMDRKALVGELHCRICDAKFQTTITHLTDPIDVFSEWLDETQERETAQAAGIEAPDEEDEEAY